MTEPIREILASLPEPYAEYKREILSDFWIGLVSREASLLGRREVLTGKAKFGILGDGKEVPQLAMARAFEPGDFRAGYYRDQTFMMAKGLCSVRDYFAQLYADPVNDPFSKGRQMNAHFANPLVHQDGRWMDHTDQFNISSDISSTAGQMARALGLALASKYYRQFPDLAKKGHFSREGREVSFCTIGDASTSEGIFWETLNAAAVMQVPLAVSVWDDGYGISVPIELQTVKSSISRALEGFADEKSDPGIKIIRCRAWDYPGLVNAYRDGIRWCRKHHRPVLFHIQEVTQPQGHSTSGSHERYKSKERLQWETEFDCLSRMEHWMQQNEVANQEQCAQLRELAKAYVRGEKASAWTAYLDPILVEKSQLEEILRNADRMEEAGLVAALSAPGLAELIEIARRVKLNAPQQDVPEGLEAWLQRQYEFAGNAYHRDVFSETAFAATRVSAVPALYPESPEEVNGYQILNAFFEQKLQSDPSVLAFGEDVGRIGDVNQGFAGLQEKFGDGRVFDCGIREWSIIGQAIGTAMRGLRPIAEIQYLDYIVYALSPLMDDLATLRYRSGGRQAAPAIIRTRGHRLEGIWHSGSPIGLLLHALRGVCLCVPRNMTQAAGMYNALLKSDDPGLIIECLNGYRLKEPLPSNLDEFTVPIGEVEMLSTGDDLTLITYGSCVRIAQSALNLLTPFGVCVELIDAQCLLPFDISRKCADSVRKTNKLVVLDEDVPGAASAFILQQVLETQGAYRYLDASPQTITAKQNRPPYGSTGDYFTKPNAEDVAETILGLLREYDPQRFRR
ncbi:MAG: transketolase [Saprospiraceae bacterium]|nr:transketolase [Saprospiraceae bacterium]